jgi:hypothetical protein
MKDLASCALAGIRSALPIGLLDAEESRRADLVGILPTHGLKNSLALSEVLPPQPQVEGTWEALRSYR